MLPITSSPRVRCTSISPSRPRRCEGSRWAWPRRRWRPGGGRPKAPSLSVATSCCCGRIGINVSNERGKLFAHISNRIRFESAKGRRKKSPLFKFCMLEYSKVRFLSFRAGKLGTRARLNWLEELSNFLNSFHPSLEKPSPFWRSPPLT